MFLDSDELFAFTGYKHKSAQIKILMRRGVPFDIAGGRPVVLREAVEKRLGGVTQPESRKKPSLNLTEMKD